MEHNYSEKFYGDSSAEYLDLNDTELKIGKMDGSVKMPYIAEVPEILLENQESLVDGIQGGK